MGMEFRETFILYLLQSVRANSPLAPAVLRAVEAQVRVGDASSCGRAARSLAVRLGRGVCADAPPVSDSSQVSLAFLQRCGFTGRD